MGTNSFASKSEQGASPAHRVELSSFIMAETLVTQRLWDFFIQDTGYVGYTYCHGYYGTVDENIQGPDSPAIFMTWSEAIVFCNWLSDRMGLEPAYSITGKLDPELRGGIEAEWIRGRDGYRLITEAEWEYVMYERGSSRETLLAIYKNELTRPQQKPLPSAMNGQLTSFAIMAYPNFGISEMTWDEHGVFTNESQVDPTGVSGLSSRGDRKVRRFFIGQIFFNRLSMRIAGGEGEFIGIRLAQDRL
jgi:formylglycine-generating enzyme required for sulfatase activity